MLADRRPCRREDEMHAWMKTAVAVAACGACFVAGHVVAQEDPGAGGFQMPEWAQKGPEQEAMAKSVGDWDVTMKMWMMPGQPPMESKGTAKAEMLYDGRYLKNSMDAEMMGTPFEGMSLTSYDRVDEEYVAIWIDSMSTYMSVSRGKEQDGAITYEMNDPDWMTGAKKKTSMAQKWIDDDTYMLTFMDTGPDGSPRTTMEMTYTRQKPSEK